MKKIHQKLDAKFEGVITKVKDGSIVPSDEYVVFLAKDTAFANVLPKYLDECRSLGADDEQCRSVQSMIIRVDQWRRTNPEKCKVPDANGEKLLT